MSVALSSSTAAPMAPSVALAQAAHKLVDADKPTDSFVRVINAVLNPLTPAEALQVKRVRDENRTQNDWFFLGGPVVRRRAGRRWLAGHEASARALYVVADGLTALGAGLVFGSGGVAGLALCACAWLRSRHLSPTPAGVWEARLIAAVKGHNRPEDWDPRGSHESREEARIAWVRQALDEQVERLRCSGPIDRELARWERNLHEPSKSFDKARRVNTIAREFSAMERRLRDDLARSDSGRLRATLQESRELLARHKGARFERIGWNDFKAKVQAAERAQQSLPSKP